MKKYLRYEFDMLAWMSPYLKISDWKKAGGEKKLHIVIKVRMFYSTKNKKKKQTNKVAGYPLY